MKMVETSETDRTRLAMGSERGVGACEAKGVEPTSYDYSVEASCRL
jgi:hypothetical protein